ncbi:hypothetical protein [Streptomyces stackebrandtii]|uniref:hypothetical protein n=1 Tax=Streptomyces stackebrandtii TaxID=3051177 RepID=UPI0028DBA527|nr:hypothetical protein [Streptomyces sp. DSM 40976]
MVTAATPAGPYDRPARTTGRPVRLAGPYDWPARTAGRLLASAEYVVDGLVRGGRWGQDFGTVLT